MNIDISSVDNQKLSQLFYYLQDISLELQSAFGIFQIVESTLNGKGTEFFHEYEANISIQINKANPQTIYTMAKIALQTCILNICRFAEAVNGCGQLLNKYCPESHKRFKTFIKDNYSQEIKKYRNAYFAHPFDDKTKDFTPRHEILELTEKILNIPSIKKVKMIDFLDYIKKMHALNISDPDLSLTYAIHGMSKEILDKNIKLTRI